MKIFLLLIILIEALSAKDFELDKNLTIPMIQEQIFLDSNISIENTIIGNLGIICIGGYCSKRIIQKHKYKKIQTTREIKKLENMKTYILFPINITFSYTESRKYKRYKKVLETIQELPKYDENISKLDDKKINKFILLAKEKALEDEPITPKNYNYKLSNQIISTIEKKSTLSFKSEGPFLVTTMNNIITNKNITCLYIDLSEFNNSAIDEIINSYKQHLIDKGNSDFTTLEKLKYKILALLTNANDNIHIVKSAVAGGIE